MTTGKSLTDPPENLKEAIDWVIKIKNDNNTDDLAATLEKFLKRDGSDAAVRVKGVYEKICEKFCNISDTLDGRPAPVLKYYLKNLEMFEPVKRPDDETNEKMLERLKGGSASFTSYITTLAGGL
ncbi:extracellular matrix-binding ebh, putative [Babesia caballi]|uniref:Extracellular matrix-binding ebh, putative n=1 Tax=Babesia caballi TaxID=5871 RepID=A0AAV4LZ09_BABCB|nr:extracellular matrix-binding ebh, putative [Babesia caballi]GIX65937.1 extracellular matrix-binding ebh, putative [Babesia caballi]